ncbi:phage protein [Vibrio fluvialis]|nr:phage protein [Vibrio fluvialis]
MKYHEMSKNYIFREFECGLTKEQTAELCFKSVRTVTEWDKGKTIPPECKRLMRIYCKNDLSPKGEWAGFSFIKDKLRLPNGQSITPQQLLTGVALLEIQSELELKTTSYLLKIAREIARIKLKDKTLQNTPPNMRSFTK